MKALVCLDLPDYRIGNDEVASGRLRIATLETMFEAMTRVNVAWMLAHKCPLLYRSGVRYRREDERGDVGEIWKDASTILKDGFDDCEGLASFLAAELRVKAPNSVGPMRYANAYVKLKTTSMPGMLHAIVFDPVTGKVFDPSRKLGMNAKAEF